jgi:hypothetical protein
VFNKGMGVPAFDTQTTLADRVVFGWQHPDQIPI